MNDNLILDLKVILSSEGLLIDAKELLAVLMIMFK